MQSFEESECTSEYILDIPDDQSEKACKSENKSICVNSKNQINTKDVNLCTKSEQLKKIDLPLTKPPHSLLVHPNKIRQQSPNNNNKSKNFEESETTSEHILEAPSDPSEKTIFTKRFVLARNHGRNSVQSRQPEKVNALKSSIKTASSSLSNPNQIKKQSNVKNIPKFTDESKFIQETPKKQSDKPIITKRFVLADNQPQKSIQSQEPPNKIQNQINMKCDIKNQEESIYVLTIQDEKPDKSKITKKFTNHCEQTEKKLNSNAFKQQSFNKTEDTEFSSDCILEELEEKIENWNKSDYNNEFASSSELFFNSSQSNTVMKLKQIEKVESKQKLNETQNAHLNKIKQQTINKDEQINIDESDITTEDDYSEKTIVTEKFLIANIQIQDSLNLKKLENVEQQKKSNDQQTKMKCNQKNTEESEYIIKLEEEKIEKPIDIEKNIDKSTECVKLNHPEKVEQLRSPNKNHCSFLLHQHKNQNQSNMKCYRKLTEESEVTSEYILEEPENSTKKIVLSSNQKQEKVEQSISSEKPPCSISSHTNIDGEQLNTKCNQKATEESEFDSEKAIVTQKFLLCNLQTQQDLSTSNADEKIEPMIQSKVSSLQPVNNYNDKIELETTKNEREKCEIKPNIQLNQVVNEPKKDVINETKNQVVNEQKKQVVDESKNQVVTEPKNQGFCEQKKQVISEPKKDAVNETKSKDFNEQKNQVIDESKNQVVIEPKNQGFCEQKKQVISEPKKDAVNETKSKDFNEQKNQVIDDQKKSQQKKKPFLSTYDPSIFYNDSVGVTRCTFDLFQNQPIEDNADASTFDKSGHLSFIRINKLNMDESEFTSEYILKMPNEQPEKATVTEKSNQQEKTSPSKSPVKRPNSPLSAHQNKGRQLTFRKNNQTNIKESENACEYILELPVEQPEKEEPLKSTVKKSDSLPIQAEENIKSPNIKRNKKAAEESEYACEFILKVPNEQQEKTTLTEKFILPNDEPKENTKSKQQEKVEQSKSPSKTPCSQPTQAEKNIKSPNIKRNQKAAEESEYACEFILKVPNEQQENPTLTEKFILPNDEPKENTKSKQPEKEPHSHLNQAEKNIKSPNIKRNKKAAEESEYACEFVLKVPNDQQEKPTLNEKFILPNDEPKENTKSKQQEKVEQSKSPSKIPCSQPTQAEKSQTQSNIKRNKKTTEEPELESEYILVIPEEQLTKTDTTKTFILPIDQSLQNKISKQPAKSSNKDSYLPLMLQEKTKQQTINKRNQSPQEECVCEYILQIPEEQIEKAIITKKSKDQTPLVSINSTIKNKPETNTQFNSLNIQKEQLNKETVNDKLNKNSNLKEEVETPNSRTKNKQQPIKQEPLISSQYHLAELEEQIEKWCRSEYLEFASSSEKIFNSSLSSISPKLTQPEKVEQVYIQDEAKLQAFTNDDDLLPETTEESYSEKTIVTPKFLLCNLKTQQNLNSQTDEIIEQVIPSKMSCSHLILPNEAGADYQYFKINFQTLSEYEEIEPGTLKKETEKGQINMTKNQAVNEPKNQDIKTQKNQVVNEQKNKVVDEHNRQVVDEPKNQDIKTQKNQVVNEQKNKVVNEHNKQVVKEPKNHDIKTQTNQVVNEHNKQVIKEQKNQTFNEEKKKEHQKKPFVSTYDPSIFYNDSIDISRCKFEFQKHHHVKNSAASPPDQRHLTVSLKDIGLEGLDSNNIEKISEIKNKSRLLIHVSGLGEKTRDKIEPIPKSEVVCKISPYERKDKLISTIKKVEHIDPYFTLFSLSEEQNSVVGSNTKPASLLDSTQKAQKIQAIKPKAGPKNCQKSNKSGSFNSSYDEYQLSNLVCKSPRRYKSPNNDF